MLILLSLASYFTVHLHRIVKRVSALKVFESRLLTDLASSTDQLHQRASPVEFTAQSDQLTSIDSFTLDFHLLFNYIIIVIFPLDVLF